MEFVPFDLEGSEHGDDIVNVGTGGDIASQQVFTVIEAAAATSAGGHFLPGFDIFQPGLFKDCGALAQKDGFDINDAGREPQHRIDQG